MTTPQNDISAALAPLLDGRPHMAIIVDREPLDVLLERLAPGNNIVGTVPAHFVWPDEREVQVVRSRFLPQAGARTVAPVLVCPDDLDFSCIVVVAEVEASGDHVVWQRLGLDRSPWSDDRQSVGSRVEWLPTPRQLVFSRTQYSHANDELWTARKQMDAAEASH